MADLPAKDAESVASEVRNIAPWGKNGPAVLAKIEFPTCPTKWPSPDDPMGPHLCVRREDHRGSHQCGCGTRIDGGDNDG